MIQIEKRFKKRELPEISELVSIVERWSKTEDWTKQNGQFIPYPATWLNSAGWEDELREEDIVLTPEEKMAEIRRELAERRKRDVV